MAKVDVSLFVNSLFCYHGADKGDSEPYLWVVGFKFDGETLKQQLANLVWTPGMFESRGSHGNLGSSVSSGVTLDIPHNVGLWETTLEPIFVTDFNGHDLEVPGVIGFAAVLLEENNVGDAAAEAGHQALNTFVRTTISDFIDTLSLTQINQQIETEIGPQPDAGAAKAAMQAALAKILKDRFKELSTTIADGAEDVVSDAIRDALGLPAAIWAAIDKDETMGHVFHFATAAEMAGAAQFNLSNIDWIAGGEGRGAYAYNLYSSISAKLKWVNLQSELPADHDIRIDGITTKYSRAQGRSYIIEIGGVVDGRPWWLGRNTAVDMIKSGDRGFYIQTPDGARTKVVVGRMPGTSEYLTTTADDRDDNNLSNLPVLLTVPGFRKRDLVPG